MTSTIHSDLSDNKRTITEQEIFWAGEFGEAYTQRNQVDPTSRKPFFHQLLSLVDGVQSICEMGANRGHNLAALQQLRPELHLTGVELNRRAFRDLSKLPGIASFNCSIQDFPPNATYDLVFTSGVLIHVAPEDLTAIYAKLARLSARYVLMVEYFNPIPVEVGYRGHSGKLFKRDFASEFLDAVDGWIPTAYGFLWKRMEPAWDNATWTLMKRCA